MKINSLYRSSLILLGTLCLAATTGKDVTPAERDHALRYLTDTRNNLAEAVKGLSEAQWKFKAGPDRWSVAEVVEHLALTEELIVQGVLGRLASEPAPSSEHDAKQVAAMILTKVPDRSVKAQAPPELVPTGRWSPTQALDHFLTGREQTIAILKSTRDLRAHAVNHPAFGSLDGYEWVLTEAAHTERHTRQILEVKADPNFRKN